MAQILKTKMLQKIIPVFFLIILQVLLYGCV